jgi:DNA-binding MarR family transcriptional regulator
LTDGFLPSSGDGISARGYLERRVDETDRRRQTIALSERGRAAASVTRAAVGRVDAALVRAVGREHIEQTRATLMALAAQAQKGE